MDLNPNDDKDTDKHTKPSIAPPGKQSTQTQQSNAPPPSRTQWIPPSTGNPDLDPIGSGSSSYQRSNPLSPQGMLFDPRQLLDAQRQSPDSSYGRQPDFYLPPGARFDPYGPPDPSQVGPGRPPLPSSQYGVPDPDHLPPPGMKMPEPHKTLKGWPPGGGPFSRGGRFGGRPPGGGLI